MDRDRWKRVPELFHAALELPSNERYAFLVAATEGDADIQSQVVRLLEADERAGSYLESPVLNGQFDANQVSSPCPFKIGDVLNGRFRILRQLGEGGMGFVFEAYDCEVGVQIALKVIRPEIAGNSNAWAFFRREVRTARTITHPNVCRTYDLNRGTYAASNGESRELVFLTMELLDGETLAKILARDGRFGFEKALDLARQIASGLDAAHAAGIVHRDIKPANVILVANQEREQPWTRAVITDFGLARFDPGLSSTEHSAISHAARYAGTLAYMAPEQLEGGKVSPATDIYAFGLLLYEMVTGVRTFPSNGLLSGIAQRLRGKLPSARAILPEIPQSWEIAIEGSLRLDPEERFQKASGVIQAIEGNLTSLSQLNIASYQAKLKARSRPEWLTRRTVIVWSMIFAVVMALLAFFFRQYSLEADSRVATGAKVYLTPIRNETGEKSLDNVTELIQAGLAQSAQIDLLDQGAVGDTLQGMTKSPDTVPDARTAREIAMRTGAARVVFAALSGSGGNYRLDIDVQQPASTPTRYRQDWNESFPWQSKGSLGTSSTLPPELLIAVRKANDWIRKTVGESSNDIARLDAPPEDVTTDNWQALSEYATAEQLQRHQQTESAIQALQNAIQLDPQFSLAYARLGDHLVGLGRYRDGYLAYQRALDTDQQRRLSRRQRDQIRGIYALDSNDFEAAEAAFRDSTIYFPNDYSGWFDRGYPLMMLGRTDEAIATLKHAYQIDQTRLSAPFELANAYISLGQWSNASEWLDIAKKHNRAESVADAEGISLFLQGRFAEAEKQFQLLIQSPRQEDHRLGYSLLSRLYAEQGKKADALGTLGDAIAIHLNTHSAAQATSDFLDRAYLECQYGEFDPCLKDVEAALDLDRSPQSAIEASAILGRAFPQLSGKRAHHCLALLHGLISDQSYDGFGTIGDLARLRVEGETLLASGQWQKALASFEQADKLDAPVNEREYIARAFEEAANHEPVLNTARLLRLEALEAYGRVALHPNTAWQYAEKWKPGFYADQLSAYLRLAAMTGTRNRDTEAALQRYRALRPIDSRVLNPTEQTRN